MAGDTGGGVSSVGLLSLLPFKEARFHSPGSWQPLPLVLAQVHLSTSSLVTYLSSWLLLRAQDSHCVSCCLSLFLPIIPRPPHRTWRSTRMGSPIRLGVIMHFLFIVARTCSRGGCLFIGGHTCKQTHKHLL